MAIFYSDLFDGAAGPLTSHTPDTGVNPWTSETQAGVWQLNGAGAVVLSTNSQQFLVLTGDAAPNEYHTSVVEGVFAAIAGSGSQIGVGARHSGTGAENDVSRNGYMLWVSDQGYMELRKLEAGVITANVGGFPGSGTTQISIPAPATDNVKLMLVTRNSGADVELEAWYNINDAGWNQVTDATHLDGIYTDVAPSAAFTSPGRDTLIMTAGAGVTPSILSFTGDTVEVDSTAPTVTAFTISTPNVVDGTVITIDTFTATDAVGVTGYKLTESATPPLAGDAGWAGTAQTTYDLGSYRSTTLYPWAKDAAGNVSAVYGTPIAVSASASGAPVVTNVAVADASLIDSHVFSVTITATDDVGVTGYAVTTSATPPGAAQQAGAAFSFDTGAFGDFNLYGWAFDAGGNVSAQAAPVAVRSVDSTAVGATVFGLGFNGGINA